jgi:nitrogen fixation-related uncharacterized protein
MKGWRGNEPKEVEAMLGTILVVVALVLTCVDLFSYHRRTPNGRYYLLPIAVILICLALLVGVDPLIAVKN